MNTMKSQMQKKEFHTIYHIRNPFLDGYGYDDLFVPPMLPLEGDEKVKAGNEIKTITSNKLFSIISTNKSWK